MQAVAITAKRRHSDMALLIRALKCAHTHVCKNLVLWEFLVIRLLQDILSFSQWGLERQEPVGMSLVTAGQICLYPPKPPPPTGNQTEAVFQVCVLTIICAFESLAQMLLPSDWVLGQAGAVVRGVRAQNKWKPKALRKHEFCEPGCPTEGYRTLERSFKQEAGVDDWAKMSCRCVENPMLGEPPSSLEGDKQAGKRLTRRRREGTRKHWGGLSTLHWKIRMFKL